MVLVIAVASFISITYYDACLPRKIEVPYVVTITPLAKRTSPLPVKGAYRIVEEPWHDNI